MNVTTWKPAKGCKSCHRAEQLFDEHTRIAFATHAAVMKKIKEQAAEIERLRKAVRETDLTTVYLCGYYKGKDDAQSE